MLNQFIKSLKGNCLIGSNPSKAKFYVVILYGENKHPKIKCPVCQMTNNFKKETREVMFHGKGASDFLAHAIGCNNCGNIMFNARHPDDIKII